MIKNLVNEVVILCGFYGTAQVGINTDMPKATLDVTSTPSDLTKIDGIIAPRLKGVELKSKDSMYTSDQIGAIVYITEALDANSATSSTADDVSSKTIEMSTVGYYYFNGNIWKKIGGVSPWNISGTNQTALSNLQNIYQTGRVGIGFDPGASPNTNLYINENTTAAGSGDSYGVQNRLVTNKEGAKTGLFNYMLDKSLSGTGSIRALDNTGVDVSKVPRNGVSGNFSYFLTGSKDNSGKTITGIASLVSVSAVGGELKSGTIYGNAVNANASATTGNLTLVGDMDGYSGYASLSALPGYITNAAGDTSGSRLIGQAAMKGGTVNANNLIGTVSGIEVAGTGGTLNVSGYAAALRSNFNFASSNLISANINALYGLLIEGNSGKSQNSIGKSYGIYIKSFRFNGDSEANAYNFYSEGENTKNYFQGKIGLGTTTPGAKLHIVKSSSDLTPAIISGCNDYSDNATAIAAGLTTGSLYRTGDILKIVH